MVIASNLPKPSDAELPAPGPLPDETDDRLALVARIRDGIRAVAAGQRCSVAASLHRAGISMAHLQVLWVLDEHGPQPVGRLADVLGIAVPNATGLLDRMEQRGLISRERVADDRRVVLVRVTPAGRDVAEQVDGWRSGVVDRVLAGIDAPGLARIAVAIDEVRAALEPVQGSPAWACAHGRNSIPHAPEHHEQHTGSSDRPDRQDHGA